MFIQDKPQDKGKPAVSKQDGSADKNQKSSVDKKNKVRLDAKTKERRAEIQARFGRHEARGRAVERHEDAHEQTAGHLAGSKTINTKTVTETLPNGETMSKTYADSGSVMINMPGMPSGPPKTEGEKAELEDKRKDFEIANNAALAPNEPLAPLSDADLAVSAKAMQGMSALDSLIGDFKPGKQKDGKDPFGLQALA